MKKRVAYLLIAALSLSACGSGTENAQKASPDTTVARTRNGTGAKFLGNVGAGFATGLAMNAIGMGLAAIPGMPKEIAGLFGGGGADNAEVLAAIAEIKTMIEGLDKKIDAIQTTLNDLTSNVAALNEKVDVVSRNLCGATTLIQTAPLKEVMTFVNSDWRDLFGDEGAARQAIANAATSKLAFSSNDEKAILDIYNRISKNYKSKYNQAIYGDVLLSKNGQRGLIAQIQACTLTQKRFLTTKDSLTWKAYVDSFVYNQFKALQVELFVLGFESYLEAKSAAASAGITFDTDAVKPNTRAIAKVIAEFIANVNAEYSMVQNVIPAGQIIDTATRKAWTAPAGLGTTTLAAAMTTCLSNSSTFSNTRSVYTTAGITSQDINPCPSNTGLDGVGIAADTWRIPHLWEVSASSLVAGKTDWYNSGLGAGLIDSGSNGVGSFSNANGSNNCGPNGTSGTPCTTAAQYIRALGGGTLIDRLASDVSAVWTNTSYAATYKSPSHAANRTTSNPDIAIVNNVFKTTTQLNSIAGTDGLSPEVASGGWRHDTWVDRMIYNTCQKETQSRYQGSMTSCMNLYNNDTQNDRCEQLKADTPVLHGVTQTHVVNIGPAVSNKTVSSGGTNYSVPAVWGGVAAFATGKYFVSQTRVDSSFLCQYYWKDRWGSWGMYAHFRNYLPQTASTILVRDLAANEIYYFLDGDSVTNNSVSIRQKYEAPTINISTTDATYRVDTYSTFGNTLTVRCIVVPATSLAVPTTWTQLPEGCVRATDNALPLGKYIAYAMAYDTVSKLYSPMSKQSFSIVGPTPLLPGKISFTAGTGTASVTASTLQPEFSYDMKVVAPDGSISKCKILIAVGSCGISGLNGNTVYKASVVVTSGARTKESSVTNVSVQAPATTTTTTSTTAPIAAPAVPQVKPRDASAILVKRNTTDTSIISYEARFEDGRTACTFGASESGCTISGLQNGFPYSFTLVAVTKAGRSMPTIATAPVTPIPAPLQPSGFLVSSNGAHVDVSISSNPLSSPVSLYRVQMTNPAGEEFTCDSPGTLASCSIDGVTRGVGYLVQVTALNDSGTTNPISRKYFVVGPPAQPVIKEASASDSSLYIEIDDANVTANTDHFVAVTSPGNKTCEFALPATGCTLPATNGTNYTVTIVAISNSGEKGPSIKSKVLSPMAPTPPAPEPTQVGTKTAVISTPTEKEVVKETAALPVPTAANVPPSAPTVAISKKYSIAALRSLAGGLFAKATAVKVKIAGASKSVCSSSAAGITGKKAGYCVLTLAGVAKSAGKKINIKQLLTVAVIG